MGGTVSAGLWPYPIFWRQMKNKNYGNALTLSRKKRADRKLLQEYEWALPGEGMEGYGALLQEKGKS